MKAAVRMPMVLVLGSMAAGLGASAVARDTLLPGEVDAGSLIAALGKSECTTVAKAFAYVRDRVAYSPYRGVRRGPGGTYLCQAGNAIDRALLLAELVKMHGVPVRFAHAELTDQAACRLLDSLFADLPKKVVRIEEVAKESPKLRTSWEAVKTQAGRLGKTDLVGPCDPASDAAVMGAVRDHWWVQAKIHGRWTDLDPTGAKATVGRSVARAQGTCDAVPRRLRCRVGVQIHAWYEDKSQRRKQVVVSRLVAAPDLAGRAVQVTYQSGGTGQGAWHCPTLTVAGQPRPGDRVPHIDATGGRFVGEDVVVQVIGPGRTRRYHAPLSCGTKPPRTGDVAFAWIVFGPVRSTWLAAARPKRRTRSRGGLLGGLTRKIERQVRSRGVPGGDGGLTVLEGTLGVLAGGGALGRRCAARAGAVVVHDGPQVALGGVRSIGRAQALSMSVPIDDVRLVGRQGSDRPAVASATMARALLRDALRTELLKRATGQTPVSAATLFDRAKKEGVALRRLHGRNDKGLDRLDLSPSTKRAIAQDLAAGRVVIAPARAVPWASTREGWVRVEPGTGKTSFAEPRSQSAGLSAQGTTRSDARPLEAAIHFGAFTFAACSALDSVRDPLKGGGPGGLSDAAKMLDQARIATHVVLNVLSAGAEASALIRTIQEGDPHVVGSAMESALSVILIDVVVQTGFRIMIGAL